MFPSKRRAASGWSLGAWLLVCLLSVACATQRAWPPLRFPADTKATVLRIREPLLKPDLAVEVAVQGDNGREAKLWMTVDSGAEQLAVPRELGQQLALREYGRSRVRSVEGQTEEQVSIAKRFALGPWLLSDVALGLMRRLAPGRGIIGQSILRRAPWEIAWDHGTLTLGAGPWKEGESIASLPLYPFDGHQVDEVELLLNGRTARFLFDTGAAFSAIPESLATKLGLKSRAIPASSFGTATSALAVERVFIGDVALGSLELPGQSFAALPAGEHGLLGLDILSRFDLHVTPGERLLLRRRGDLRATAVGRIARWEFLAKCRTPGCIRARIEPAGVNGRLDLEFEAPIARPLDVLFGCAEPSERPESLPSLAELITAGRLSLPFRHLIVSLQSTRAARASAEVPLAGRLWFSGSDAGCRELSVLDVAPTEQTEVPSVPVFARATP
jgi:predicted aspartyl protease